MGNTLPFSTEEADLVFINGHIITVDADDSIAEAVAVKDGLILKVGTTAEINEYIGTSTKVVDLEGKTMTPGIIDSHNHMQYFGQVENDYTNLRPPDVTSIADIVAKIEEAVNEAEPEEWIIGDGFYKLTDGRLPSKEDLDPVSPNNPVMVTHIGGHFGTANSKALEIAGIDSSTVVPGGIVGKDSLTGQPTGLLWNHPAMDAVRMHYPPFSLEDLENHVLFTQDRYIPFGLTSFQDVNTRALIRLQAYLNAEEDLKLRGYLMHTVERSLDATISLEYTELFTRPFLTYRGNKFLLDGQPPTSYTYEPHSGPEHTIPTWDPDTLEAIVKNLHNDGRQLAFHVMGDRAIDLALDVIEAALIENPNPDHRHRLEHCMIPRPESLQRIKELGVVVSFQPAIIYHNGEGLFNVWGLERMLRFMPMRSMLEMGIPMALGSDFPTVVELAPQLTLYSAITRKTMQGYFINQEETLTIQEALRIHTMGSAYAAFEEDIKGSIEEGKYADLVVWSGDLYSVPTEEIKDLEVEMTVIDGKVYDEFPLIVTEHNSLHSSKPFMLYPCFPNPSGKEGDIQIHYQIMENRSNIAVPVTLEVYNMNGIRVRILKDEKNVPGFYTVNWDGRNDLGGILPNGAYIIQLSSGYFVETNYIILQ